jgi:hypothetical protein
MSFIVRTLYQTFSRVIKSRRMRWAVHVAHISSVTVLAEFALELEGKRMLRR